MLTAVAIITIILILITRPAAAGSPVWWFVLSAVLAATCLVIAVAGITKHFGQLFPAIGRLIWRWL